MFKMSKIEYKYWPFILLLLFTTCEKDDTICKKDDPVDICIGFEDKVYKYSIYDCTEADSLDCSQKVFESILLPEQYLKCSSTDSLISSCLSYPYLGLIWAYNSIQYGYERVLDNYNGFDELFIRVDANIGLMTVYQEMDPEDVNNFSEPADRGRYMSQFTFIELTIAQYHMIDKLTLEETALLLEICLDKYYSKAEIPSYTFIGEMSVLAIMSRVLYSKNYKPFMDQLLNIPNLSYFIESASLTGLINIEEITQFIVSNTESYLSENK
jgi:hypothetical protein